MSIVKYVIKKGVSIMKIRIFRKAISLLLAVITVMSMFAVTAVSVSAASSSVVGITIDLVTRKYREAASFLTLCNNYRAGKDLPAWEMDADLLEPAMVKAAELAVYVDEKNLDGTSFLDNTSEYRGILVGYDVTNNSGLITAFEDDSVYMENLNSKKFKSAGVGVCSVMNKKYIVVLLSSKTAVPVDSAVLTQSNQRISQSTNCKVEYLENVRMNFNDNDQILCGGDAVMRLIVTNKFYPASEAYISGTVTDISSSDTSVFKPNGNGTITGIKPGTAVITMKLKGAPSVSASATIKAVAKTFSGCTISEIPDQTYSGVALTPSVSIVSKEGVKLEVGKDYTLTYSNNINVGTAVVKISGKGSYSGASASVNFNIINNPSAFSVTVKTSVPAVSVGQATNVIASVANATNPVKYKFEVSPQGVSNFTTIQAESTNSSCTYTPTAEGTYTLRVTATDGSGKTAMSNVLLEVTTPINLTVTLSSTYVTLGNTVTINAKASGGSSPYKFAYYVLEPGKSTYTALASFGSLQTLTYTPSAAGTYQVRVDCKGSNDITVTKSSAFSVNSSALSNSSTISATSVTAGTAVTLTGSASGGASPYKYAYYYKLSTAGSWTTAGTEFGTATSASFTPSTAGTYNVKTVVKDSNGTTADKTFTLTVKAKVADLVNISSISSSSAVVGDTVTLTAKASGGTTPYKYAYYYKKSSESSWTTIGTEFGTAASASFKPTAAGTYNAKVIVKDSASKTAEKSFSVTVASALVNNSSIKSTKQPSGVAVMMTGAASGGTTPYKYAYYYKRTANSTWNVVGTEYGTATSASFTPSAAGTFDIKINVKDNNGKVATKTFTYTATDPLVNNSKLNTSKLPAGNSVVITGAASGGTSPYTYAYYYKRSTNDKWNAIGTEFSSATSASFKPVSSGTFDIKVSVKDKTGTVAVKKFTFTATEPLVNKSSVSTTRLTLGNTLTLTGSASGGTTPYTYSFMYKRSTSTKWNTIGTAYDGSTSATLKPVAVADYDIKINVKDKTGAVTAKTFTVKTADITNTSTVDYSKVGVGTPVTITGKASGGNPSYKYAFYYKRATNSSWNTIGTAFGTATTASFSPTEAVSYNIKVNAKDSQGFVATKTFTITASDLSNISSVNSKRVGVGTAVELTGKASGGKSGYKYAFLYKRTTNSSWNTIGTAYDGSTTAKFTPVSAVSYNVRIIAKDSNNAVAIKSFTVTATDLTNSSTVSYTQVGVGTTVSIKGKASGGKSSYKYAFYFKRSANTKWNLIGTAYDGSTSASFTPTAAADFDVKVIVKDSSSTISVKTMKVKVTSLTNNSTLSASTVKAGKAVTITGKASGGTTPYKYAYYYKRTENSKWNTIGTEFGTATSAKLTPASAAVFEIKVVIKDNSGTVAIKVLKLTAT